MKDRLSIIIPSRNNYEFVVSAYDSLRNNLYYDDHQIIIYDDGDDGTYKQMRELKMYSDDTKLSLLNNSTNDIHGTGQAMNICKNHAIHDKLMLFHADMYVSPNCDLHIMDVLDQDTKNVVSLTRIEPPLHPEGKEKIVKDFGMYVSDFDEDGFLKYVKEVSDPTKTTSGVFAPWAINKEFYNEIGGHDPQFNRYHEDTDIFYRMKLAGAKFTQLWNGFVYHYTCRANKFANGVEEVNPEFEEMRHNMLMKFIDKWKLVPKLNEYSYPVISSSYERINIKGIINNITDVKVFEYLIHLCDSIETNNIPEHFDNKEQLEKIDKNISYDLKFEVNNQENIDYLINYILLILPYIYNEYNAGEYEMENLKLEIVK